MKNVANTIEDLLEILAGLQGQAKMQIESSDATIMHSIARQSFKGTALTDRQFALMKEKLQTYRNQFTALDYNFDTAVDTLRQPLRHIDRSKYIKIVDYPDDIVYESAEAGKFIKIRFPFKKSDIMLINGINNIPDYYHSKGTHEHYFALTEVNVFNVIDNFKNKSFNIDQDLLDLYNEICDIKENRKDYICEIHDNKILNMNPKIKDIAITELGPLTVKNKLMYIDRSRRYGINIFDKPNILSLKEKIAYRDDVTYQSKPSKELLSEILSSMWELQRFPMIVILDKQHAEEQLHEMITFYRDILSYEEQSVLFRTDGANGFNELIRDRKLNNWVDKNTKIVYISNNDKLPKLLLRDTWTPISAFSYTSTVDLTVDSYIKFNCDLTVYREEETSPFRKYSRLYG